MWYLIIGGIIAVIALACLSGGVFAPTESDDGGNPRKAFRVCTAVALFVLVLLTAIGSFTKVDARSVGVVTSLGKYQGTVGPGVHWNEPWAGVEQFPTQVQYLDLLGKDGDGNQKGATQVNFSGGGQGSVDATIRWRITEQSAEALWRSYKSFDAVRDRLITSSARDAVRVAVGGYTATDAQAGNKLSDITAKVKDQLQRNLTDDGVVVDSVSMTRVGLDDRTQQAIEKVIIAQQDKARAEVDRQKAEIEKQTNEIREKAGILNDGGLRRYCLELTNNWDQGKNGPLPATWSCLGTQPVTPTLPVK